MPSRAYFTTAEVCLPCWLRPFAYQLRHRLLVPGQNHFIPRRHAVEQFRQRHLDVFHSPGKNQEANWLPAPQGPLFMAMRLSWRKRGSATHHAATSGFEISPQTRMKAMVRRLPAISRRSNVGWHYPPYAGNRRRALRQVDPGGHWRCRQRGQDRFTTTSRRCRQVPIPNPTYPWPLRPKRWESPCSTPTTL